MVHADYRPFIWDGDRENGKERERRAFKWQIIIIQPNEQWNTRNCLRITLVTTRILRNTHTHTHTHDCWFKTIATAVWISLFFFPSFLKLTRKKYRYHHWHLWCCDRITANTLQLNSLRMVLIESLAEL